MRARDPRRSSQERGTPPSLVDPTQSIPATQRACGAVLNFIAGIAKEEHAQKVEPRLDTEA